jgi:hypothetical protein
MVSEIIFFSEKSCTDEQLLEHYRKDLEFLNSRMADTSFGIAVIIEFYDVINERKARNAGRNAINCPGDGNSNDCLANGHRMQLRASTIEALKSSTKNLREALDRIELKLGITN